MLTADLLQETWRANFVDRRPGDVLPMIVADGQFPSLEEALSDPDREPSPVEAVADGISSAILAAGLIASPLEILLVGIALGYLAANREVLEAV